MKNVFSSKAWFWYPILMRTLELQTTGLLFVFKIFYTLFKAFSTSLSTKDLRLDMKMSDL